MLKVDVIIWLETSLPAPLRAAEGDRGFAGGLAERGSPPGCSLLELSLVQSDVQGST